MAQVEAANPLAQTDASCAVVCGARQLPRFVCPLLRMTVFPPLTRLFDPLPGLFAAGGPVAVGEVEPARLALTAGPLGGEEEPGIGGDVIVADLDVAAHDRAAAVDGQLHTTEAEQLVDLARSLPYAARSWTALRRLAAGDGLEGPFLRADAWRRTHPYDAKREDAEQALTVLAAGLPRGPGPGRGLTSRGRPVSSGTGRRPFGPPQRQPDSL
ncbi:hypothetical protein [Streptomyces sp. NPDC127036]|uniref:hypothetical protein n=1 Tax=Streptomyces sp. NPDC127036 TaxID=3347112 RepID=UPI003666FDC4